MVRLPAKRLRPIRDEVYSILRQEIMSGKYKPGDRLQEEQLSTAFGISRTPVREALRKLEIEKLVDYYPHKGTIVSEFETDEIEELFLVRVFLEILITKRASLNATKEDINTLRKIIEDTNKYEEQSEIMKGIEDFNSTIFRISSSKYLTSINSNVREILRRIVTTNALDSNRRRAIYEEHSRIIDAIEMKDDELIEKYTTQHVQSSYSSYFKTEDKKLDISFKLRY